jgi:hypothetical protein
VENQVSEATAELTLVRAIADAPVELSGTVRLDLGGEAIDATVTGQAVWLGDRWALAGRYEVSGAAGGFRATLTTNGTDDNGDDLLTWRADATANG